MQRVYHGCLRHDAAANYCEEFDKETRARALFVQLQAHGDRLDLVQISVKLHL